MATATLSTPSPSRARGTLSAAVFSILGSVAAIAVAAVGLLVVPVALAIVFLPAVLALF